MISLALRRRAFLHRKELLPQGPQVKFGHWGYKTANSNTRTLKPWNLQDDGLGQWVPLKHSAAARPEYIDFDFDILTLSMWATRLIMFQPYVNNQTVVNLPELKTGWSSWSLAHSIPRTKMQRISKDRRPNRRYTRQEIYISDILAWLRLRAAVSRLSVTHLSRLCRICSITSRSGGFYNLCVSYVCFCRSFLMWARIFLAIMFSSRIDFYPNFVRSAVTNF
jgi:hypothetical protein